MKNVEEMNSDETDINHDQRTPSYIIAGPYQEHQDLMTPTNLS
jgi:hypothetical protein